jgi:putative aldouronate transport system substrate-binding protein
MKRQSMVLALVLVMLIAVPAMAWDWNEAAMEYMPIADEMTTITIMGQKNYAQYSELENLDIYNWLRENANINVTGELYMSDAYAEKSALAIASGDLPDVFVKTGWTSAQVAKYGEDGVILDLKPLIEEYCPHLIELFAKYPQVKAACTTDTGAIYAFPAINMLPRDVHTRFWMSQTWLDAVGMEHPTTLDELYNVLVAFRDNDPNGNGKKDEIPVTGHDGKTIDELVLNAYGLKSRSFNQLFDDVDGKVIFAPTTEAYKEYLKYMNKLYSEDLLDSEVFIQTEEQMNAKGGQNKIGMYQSAASWLTCTSEYGMDHFQVGPFTSEMNETPMVITGGGYSLNRCCITYTCEHPEVVVKLMDFFYTVPGGILETDGPYGGWIWLDEENGVWGYADYIYEEWDSVEAWRAGKATTRDSWGNYLDVDLSLGLDATDATGIDLAKWLNDNTATYQEPYFTLGFPSLSLNADELFISTPIENDVKNYVTNMRARFITGEDDIDTMWGSYVEAIDGMQVADLLEQYQAAYDRYIAAMT